MTSAFSWIILIAHPFALRTPVKSNTASTMLPEQIESTTELEIPDAYICPLTLEMMQDPVMSRYGFSFERSAILKWIACGKFCCPLTRQPLHLYDIVTNHYLRTQIRQFQKDNNLDITIIMTPDANQFCGYFTMPEKELDETERSEEDDDYLIEYRPPSRSSRSNRIRRGRFQSNRGQESSDRQQQRQETPRRFLGLFQPRNSTVSSTA